MENDIVEVRFKKCLKILNYLSSASCAAVYIFLIGMFIIDGQTNILLIGGLFIATAFSILWIFNTHQFNIYFGSESITKSGAFNIEISYSEIEMIKVNKDRI